jgi:hypothetical protein
MSEAARQDEGTALDALRYVTALHEELTEENGAPTLGIQNQAVDFILADPDLAAYVRRWAATAHDDDPVPRPPERLPQDEAYWRVRERLKQTMDASIFRHPAHNPP